MATRNKVRGVQVGAWLEVLQKQVAAKIETVPDGWLRHEQICKQLGLSERVASSVIAKAIHDGDAERKRFKIRANDGSVQSVWHFRLCK